MISFGIIGVIVYLWPSPPLGWSLPSIVMMMVTIVATTSMDTIMVTITDTIITLVMATT